MDSSNNNIDSNDVDFDSLRDACLTNLKILSKIQQGDKLYYTNGIFSIDSPAYLQGIARWYYAESRSNTLKNLDDFLNKVFKMIDLIYKREMKCEQSIENTFYTKYLTKSSSSVFNEENPSLMLTFINEIKNCITGLNNLKLTYKSDIQTVSSIDVIIEKLNVRVKKMTSVLSFQSKN